MSQSQDDDESEPIYLADAVKYLDRFAPEALAQVRSDNAGHDAQAVLQTSGVVLGASDEAQDAAIRALLKMLPQIYRDAGQALVNTRRKLGVARIAELAGQLLSMGSCGTLVALIAGGAGMDKQGVGYVLAGLGFAGGAVPFAVRFLRGSLLSAGDGAAKQYTELKDIAWEAGSLQARLQAMAELPPKKRSGVAALIKAGNALARRAIALLTDLGYDPARPVAA